METHNKTRIVLGSFSITFAGWWAWNAFLSGAYSDNISPYDVKGGFSETFGKDPRWWLVLIVAIAILVVLELVLKGLKKELVRLEVWPLWGRRDGARMWERELELWQEMEKDPVLMKRLIDRDGYTDDNDDLDEAVAEDEHGEIELHDFGATASSSSSGQVGQRGGENHGKASVRVTSAEVRG